MLEGSMEMHEPVIPKVDKNLIAQEVLFGDLTRGTNGKGLYQLFADRSKQKIVSKRHF